MQAEARKVQAKAEQDAKVVPGLPDVNVARHIMGCHSFNKRGFKLRAGDGAGNGPSRHRSPRHRLPFNSTNEISNRESMTWRAVGLGRCCYCSPRNRMPFDPRNDDSKSVSMTCLAAVGCPSAVAMAVKAAAMATRAAAASHDAELRLEAEAMAAEAADLAAAAEASRDAEAAAAEAAIFAAKSHAAKKRAAEKEAKRVKKQAEIDAQLAELGGEDFQALIGPGVNRAGAGADDEDEDEEIGRASCRERV